MFVFNVKVNGSKIFKCFFVCFIILLIVILSIVVFRVFDGANNSSKAKSCLPKSDVIDISANNYTNVLKTVHENIDDYVGKKICFSGFVYRVLDLQDNQFVLARDMIISSDNKSVVVGFLCEYDKAKDFSNETWVQVTGEIFKTDYHGDMPVVKVTDIKKIDRPASDEFVYPPDESYIPTSSL